MSVSQIDPNYPNHEKPKSPNMTCNSLWNFVGNWFVAFNAFFVIQSLGKQIRKLYRMAEGEGGALTCRCGHCRPVLTGIEYELAVECHVPMKLRIIIT